MEDERAGGAIGIRRFRMIVATSWDQLGFR